MQPTIGRIVHYIVGENEEDHLNYNGVQAGEVLPALIVRVWGPTCVNLRILNDGPTPAAWKTSVTEGTQPGNWQWPAKVAEVPDITIASVNAGMVSVETAVEAEIEQVRRGRKG